MPLNDSISDAGQYIPRFSLLVRKLLTSGKFMWNDTRSRSVLKNDSGDDVWEISIASLDQNWIVVLDSWTTLTYSVMTACAMNAGIDLAEIEKAARNIYSGAGNMATDILHRLKSLNCHVIVTAHPDEYIKYKVQTGFKPKESEREAEWSRMIAKSTSRPHSLTLAAYFTDVAWLEVSPMGSRFIDFRPGPGRDAGGRFDSRLPVEQGNFAKLVLAAGGVAPEKSEILIHHPNYQPQSTSIDRKSTRLNSSHIPLSRMPTSA